MLFLLQLFIIFQISKKKKNILYILIYTYLYYYLFFNSTLRIAAVKEILRILKVNGIVLIYVWAFE